jgi:histidinol dehydrogenase
LLAQAEHDVLATAILLTPSLELAQAVQAEVIGQAEDAVQQSYDRAGIVTESLNTRGAIVLTPDLDTAVDLANEFSPEHLCLSVKQPEVWAERVRNAGAIFLGEHSCEVLGDYVAGPSHVMPTGGTARFSSPVNVLDFVKVTSIVGLDPETSAGLSSTAATLARAELLRAHAAAAERRGDAPA